MGDSYDGGEANDSAESSGSVESTDSGDDSSAFDSGDTGEMEGATSGEGSEHGKAAENIAPERACGEGLDRFNIESLEYTEINEPNDGGDDESAYEDVGVTTDGPDEVEIEAPDEVSRDSPEETEIETPNEMEADGDGDEESAYEQESDEPREDETDTEIPLEQDIEEDEHESEKFSVEELEALQEQADHAAQEYNDKYAPYDRAVSKGVEGVTETANGGVSFENSDALYVTADGTKGIVTIEATGSRSIDFDKANKALGLDEQPEGYTWHHVDNYNVKDNTVTLELVRDDAHRSAMPHSGGCAQYDAVHGPTYNPPKR